MESIPNPAVLSNSLQEALVLEQAVGVQARVAVVGDERGQGFEERLHLRHVPCHQLIIGALAGHRLCESRRPKRVGQKWFEPNWFTHGADASLPRDRGRHTQLSRKQQKQTGLHLGTHLLRGSRAAVGRTAVREERRS